MSHGAKNRNSNLGNPIAQNSEVIWVTGAKQHFAHLHAQDGDIKDSQTFMRLYYYTIILLYYFIINLFYYYTTILLYYDVIIFLSHYIIIILL